MKSFAVILGIFLFTVSTSARLECGTVNNEIPDTWIDLSKKCDQAVKDQIRKEIQASSNYLAAGAHFLKSEINRPGFAKFFINAAKEEREHSMKLMEYLLTRGDTDLFQRFNVPVPQGQFLKPTSGVEALRKALELEAAVTDSIKDVIKVCENSPTETSKANANDYHLVDYLTGVFLEEQYNGQRELAGMISTLGKMMQRNGQIGEFLFDKKLLA